MSISGINSNYPTGYEIRRTTRNTSGKDFDSTALGGNGYIKKFADTTRQNSVLDIYNSMSKFGGNISKAVDTKIIKNAAGWEEWFKESENDYEKVLSDEELEQADSQESETTTEIIVKPDGSRVLVMTMSIGGMETTMSLEISKPTEVPNENSEQDADNNMPSADAEMDTVSDEMSNISTEA
ncbi:MAG: hypothetical protein K2N51_05340 [Lachnospiraceae bacterium]|nr:hypothetical protein [Lachnospiraceae bacterium]